MLSQEPNVITHKTRPEQLTVEAQTRKINFHFNDVFTRIICNKSPLLAKLAIELIQTSVEQNISFLLSYVTLVNQFMNRLRPQQKRVLPLSCASFHP